MKYLICAFLLLAGVSAKGGKPPGPSALKAVDLGSAGNYAILSKAGVSTTGTTSVTGNIATSPIAAIGLTGFDLILSADSTYSTSALVTGKIYAANYAPPTPTILTTAVGDMGAAYLDAAGRTENPLIVNPELGGQTLGKGLYKFAGTVTITGDVVFNGSKNDVWIVQIAGSLTIAADAKVLLKGGAKAKNIFWQVADGVSVGERAHVEGIILSNTLIAFNTQSTLNGKALAQTEVTMIATTIEPAASRRKSLRA